MSLEYFLFCRKQYNSTISDLDFQINNSNSLSQLEIKNLLNKKNNAIKLKEKCDKKILELCNHKFEDDYIDINPERSQKITYCIICGFNK